MREDARHLSRSPTWKAHNIKRQVLPRSARSNKCKVNFAFLGNSKFLQDLENDSVDSELLEDELNAFHQLPISKRQKVVKLLQSNPVQILLCVIVLLDAGIVIAQILLDLNSVKEKLHRRDRQLVDLIEFIRRNHPEQLHDYKGHNVDTILQLLKVDSNSPPTMTSATDRSNRTNDSTADRSHPKQAPDRPQGVPRTRHFWYDRQPMAVEGPADNDFLRDVAHGLHYASIALLGFLVVEDVVKILAMGWTFCKHRIEIFDAIIIASSFAIDLIFMGGVAGEEGQKAAAVLVILLLWRIARVVDGIVVTVKQRQEFRIRLQKRARRAAEKKLEAYESEKLSRTKQIDALKELCMRSGIPHSDIMACTPKHPCHVTTTLDALSSVAKLSVSMTMLMSSSSGVSSLPSNNNNNNSNNRRQPGALLPPEDSTTTLSDLQTPPISEPNPSGLRRCQTFLPPNNVHHHHPHHPHHPYQQQQQQNIRPPFEAIDEDYYVTFTAGEGDESRSREQIADVIVHMEKSSSDEMEQQDEDEEEEEEEEKKDEKESVEKVPVVEHDWKAETSGENPSFHMSPEVESKQLDANVAISTTTTDNTNNNNNNGGNNHVILYNRVV